MVPPEDHVRCGRPQGVFMTTMVERTLQLVGSDRSRTLRRLPQIVLVVDAGLATLVAFVAIWGRSELDIFAPGTGLDEQVGLVGPLLVAGWIAVIALRGSYSREIFGSGSDEYNRVFQATLLTAGGVGVTCYLAKFDLSRGFFFLAFALGLPVLILGRWTVRQLLHYARRHGYLQVRVLVSGGLTSVDEVARVLHREAWLGYNVIGAVLPVAEFIEETDSGVPVLGTSDAVTEIAVRIHADIIFFAGGSTGSGQEMREKLWELEEHDINVVVAPRVTDVSSDRAQLRPVGGLPLIHVDHPRWNDASRWGKRLFDIAGSALLVLALIPVLAFATLRIWAFDRGPILYRQTRVGRHGHEFACLKFRTMITDADSQIPELVKQSDQASALLFKLKDDPRVTKPGKWLRRLSVDELPQLFNVLRGDMSLVGPRPQVQREVDLYEGGMGRRLLVRPGMTGLWQVSGRSDLSPEEAMRLDLFYVDNWSMLQDLHILSRTVGAVFGSRGAY
jgi:exopolysaccharide biosynthesis polyprenyl glycosylphosphotransferase